jgi:hypothetical protein
MLIFDKIKFKIKQTFVITLIKISLFLNYPRLAALAFWLVSSRLNPETASQNTVLCVGRSIFMDDVKEMAKSSGQIKYVVIWKSYFGMISKYIFKNQTKDKLTQDNYHANNFHEEDKRKLYLFLGKMLPLLQKYIGFKAVLCGNFAYFDQQEFEKLCTDRKIPYIVLCKEGLTVPGLEHE